MAEQGTRDYMWGGLEDGFGQSLEAFIAASGGRVVLISGYRSNEHQQRLYDQAVAKYGAANAGKWAAPPGRSNHNHGLAGDLRFVGEGARDWAHKNAARFGLTFPMSHEPWHIEPIGVRNGDYDHKPSRDSYTIPPLGTRHAMDLSQGQTFGASLASMLKRADTLLVQENGLEALMGRHAPTLPSLPEADVELGREEGMPDGT